MFILSYDVKKGFGQKMKLQAIDINKEKRGKYGFVHPINILKMNINFLK